jgi:hypothetical protein
MKDLRKTAALWIEQNPEAFALFEKHALEMARKGRRFGIKGLAEFIRWTILMTWEKDAEGYRLNNDLTPYIGRALVAKHPALARYIEFRRCRDEEDSAPMFAVEIGQKVA